MKINGVILVSMIFLLTISSISASHFIIGRVNNALDGTSANSHTIVMWNPTIGVNDNQTDIIGQTGNSGVDNLYMIDCELLNTPCQVGDNLSVKVLNTGDNYLTNTINVTVTGAGFDVADNLSLNSPPNATLISPQNNTFVNAVNLTCSASDLDSNLVNTTLYGNWTGWHANETVEISGDQSNVSFIKNITDGSYRWTCIVQDNLSISSENIHNYTFHLDQTLPNISSIVLNESYMCGNISFLRVNCTVNDSNIDTVVIQANSSTDSINYTAQLLGGITYYKDILINESGTWSFTCFANDSARNQGVPLTQQIGAFTNSSDIKLNSSTISFNETNGVESKNITIFASIFNGGCSDANDFTVGFFVGDPDDGGTIINGNRTISINGRSNFTTNMSWLVEIGLNQIYVAADKNNSIPESNESNNKMNKSYYLTAWQEFYGNMTPSKVLANSFFYNLSKWSNSSTPGHIYFADSESNIDWTNLQAIGRNSTNASTSNDFTEIDSILGMSSFNDSVSNVFTTDGNNPKDTYNMTIHEKEIIHVPIINSTNNSNFLTGILWDVSEDTNGEFNQGDNEDLVFVTRINPDKNGFYGVYDYEIRIPSKLRQQNTSDTSNLYLYYELL